MCGEKQAVNQCGLFCAGKNKKSDPIILIESLSQIEALRNRLSDVFRIRLICGKA